MKIKFKMQNDVQTIREGHANLTTIRFEVTVI